MVHSATDIRRPGVATSGAYRPALNTAARVRCDITDQSATDDRSPATLRNEPIDRIENAEPTEPIDANEPTLPMERNECVLPMESMESRDPMLHRDLPCFFTLCDMPPASSVDGAAARADLRGRQFDPYS